MGLTEKDKEIKNLSIKVYDFGRELLSNNRNYSFQQLIHEFISNNVNIKKYKSIPKKPEYTLVKYLIEYMVELQSIIKNILYSRIKYIRSSDQQRIKDLIRRARTNPKEINEKERQEIQKGFDSDWEYTFFMDKYKNYSYKKLVDMFYSYSSQQLPDILYSFIAELLINKVDIDDDIIIKKGPVPETEKVKRVFSENDLEKEFKVLRLDKKKDDKNDKVINFLENKELDTFNEIKNGIIQGHIIPPANTEEARYYETLDLEVLKQEYDSKNKRKPFDNMWDNPKYIYNPLVKFIESDNYLKIYNGSDEHKWVGTKSIASEKILKDNKGKYVRLKEGKWVGDFVKKGMA
jgi:hypothetical protein